MNRTFVIAGCSSPRLTRPALHLLIPSAALLAGALALTACGGSSDSPRDAEHTPPASAVEVSGPANGVTATGTYNDADVAFATSALSHHAQAVRMVDLALAQGSSAEVKDVAAEIKADQAPESERMSSCLAGWGKNAPGTMGHPMDMPSDSMGEAMGHMMYDQDLTDLSSLSGRAFDQAWLTQMTAHHQGVVTMAQTELATGSDARALQLARDMMSSRETQIARMQGLLEPLPL